MKDLAVPPAALTDPKAIELLRVWAAEGEQHVSIATEVWQDPGAWGIMLADLMQHLAVAYEATTPMAKNDILLRIKNAFEAETCFPTDDPRRSS